MLVPCSTWVVLIIPKLRERLIVQVVAQTSTFLMLVAVQPPEERLLISHPAANVLVRAGQVEANGFCGDSTQKSPSLYWKQRISVFAGRPSGLDLPR